MPLARSVAAIFTLRLVVWRIWSRVRLVRLRLLPLPLLMPLLLLSKYELRPRQPVAALFEIW
jgi:hypothetical protein